MSDSMIKERIYMKGKFILTSPLMVGSGESIHTDMDVLRDSEGKVFIPGTTIAGVLRHHLESGSSEEEQTGAIRMLFGDKDKESTQSLLYIYDAKLQEGETSDIKTRDGVALDRLTKTALPKAKYDYEVIEPGTRFLMRFEVVFRAKHSNALPQLKHELYLMLKALQDGKIAFGAKTRRGFGKGILQDQDLQMLRIDFSQETTRQDAVKDWVDFTWATMGSNVTSIEGFKDDANGRSQQIDETIIEVDFSLPYSLLIRDYHVKPEDPDTIQLQSSRGPVIPGTSWAGAVRHQMKQIGVELVGNEDTVEKKLIRPLFGYVDEVGYVDETPENANASRIFFDESVIGQGKLLAYTRNKIDRFTGGTVKGALFSEKPVWGGKKETTVRLTIRIAPKKTEEAREYDKDAEIGLILLTIKDLWYGIQTVGGGANIGRGILQGREGQTVMINKKPVDIIDKDKQEDAPYMQALYQKIMAIKG